MRQEFITEYCPRCQFQTEQVRFITLAGSNSRVCSHCQETIMEPKEDMKRRYTVIAIEMRVDDEKDLGRRLVPVTVRCEKIERDITMYEDIEVNYPAYGGHHYPASVEGLPGTKKFNHLEEKAIATAIRVIL